MEFLVIFFWVIGAEKFCNVLNLLCKRVGLSFCFIHLYIIWKWIERNIYVLRLYGDEYMCCNQKYLCLHVE